MSIKNTVRRYVADAARAFDRAPVEVALAFVTAVFFSYAIESRGDISVSMCFAVAAVLAIAGAWIGTLLHALGTFDLRKRWISTAVGAIAAAVYLSGVKTMEVTSEFFRLQMLVAGATLMVIAAPALWTGGEDPNLRLRRINARIIERAIGVVLYGLALYAGLALALLAVDKLFELKLESTLYAHEYVWIMLVLVPWIIVGGIDDYVRPLDETTGLGMFQQRLIVALVPVLVAVYYIILCAYAIRIGVTGELPKNLVSPLVIAAGVLAAIALIVFDPGSETNSGLRWLRFTPLVFILLAPLGLWALSARIDAYGWTEFRLLRMVVLVALLVLALLASVQLARRRAYALRIIPLLLGVVLLLGAFGPWGVLAVARRDQEQRLRLALEKAHVVIGRLRAPRDTVSRTVPADVYAQINTSASYLQQHFGEGALDAFAPAAKRRNRGWSLADLYGLAPAVRQDTTLHVLNAQLLPGGMATRGNGEVVMRLQFPGAQTHMSGDTLFIRAADQSVRAAAHDAIAAVTAQAKGVALDPVHAHVPVIDEAGQPRGDLLILDLTVKERSGVRTVQRLDGVLMIRAR